MRGIIGAMWNVVYMGRLQHTSRLNMRGTGRVYKVEQVFPSLNWDKAPETPSTITLAEHQLRPAVSKWS